MQIFTDAAIDKLQALHAKDHTGLLETTVPEGQSDQSLNLLKHFFSIAKLLVENNDTEYWSIANNQQKVMGLINEIDQDSGTYVPVVFNEQSKMIAMTWLDFLTGLSSETDLVLFVRATLNVILKRDLDQFLIFMQVSLGFNLRVYEALEKSAQQAELGEGLTADIKEYFSTQAAALGPLTEDKYTEFCAAYQQKMQEFFDRVAQLNYMQIVGASRFVNQSEPLDLSPANFACDGLRGKIILTMLECERKLNVELKAKGLTPQHSVYNKYSVKVNPATIAGYSQRLTDAQQGFLVIVERYLNGDGWQAKLFKAVGKKQHHKDKIAIVQNLKQQFTLAADQVDSVAVNSFVMFLKLITAKQKNEIVSREQQISIGELSVVIKQQALAFLDFFQTMDESGDEQVLACLRDYEKSLESTKQASAGLG